jgi:hypothetical protein
MDNDHDEQSAEEFLTQLCGDGDMLATAQAEYARTKSPRLLFLGISVIAHERADGNNTPVPAWINDALFEAAASVASYVICGTELSNYNVRTRAAASMDVALGIRPRRGQKPYDKAERLRTARDAIFDIIEQLRTCYDIDIPTACESAYYFRDAESLAIHTAVVQARKDRGDIADDAEFQKSMREAIEESDKTFGERVGCSLDSLIDRYYREGGAFRQECLLAAKCDEQDWRARLRARWADELFGMAGFDDLWVTPDADARKYAKRPEFAALCAELGL